MKVNVKELKTIVVSVFFDKYGVRYVDCYDEDPIEAVANNLGSSCKKFNFSYEDDAEIEYTAHEFMDIIDDCLDDLYDYYFEEFDEDFDKVFEDHEDETFEDEDFEDDGEPSLFDKIFDNRGLLTISTSHKISPEDVRHTVNKVHKKHPELTEEVFDDALDVIIAYLAENESDSKLLYDLNIRDKFNAR